MNLVRVTHPNIPQTKSQEMLPWGPDEEIMEEEVICSERDNDVFED